MVMFDHLDLEMFLLKSVALKWFKCSFQEKKVAIIHAFPIVSTA